MPSCPWADGKWEYDASTPLYSLLFAQPRGYGLWFQGSVPRQRAAIPLHFHTISTPIPLQFHFQLKPQITGYGQRPSPYLYLFRVDSLFLVRGFPAIPLSALQPFMHS